jgi:probable HAF family extracellular repeat protein
MIEWIPPEKVSMNLHRRLLSLLMLTAVLSPASVSAVQYTVQSLDVLPGGLDSLAFGLNDVGQVVGDSRLDRTGNVGQSRPVVWDYSGAPHELWSDQTVGASLAAINNAGQIVGRYGTGSGVPTPGPGVPYGRAFVWDAMNGMRDLGLAPLGNSEVSATNDAGQVVGTSEILETIIIDGVPNTSFVPHAFIWDETNGIRDLGNLGGFGGFANAINEYGQVVGYGDTQDGHERAFVWDEIGGMQEIPTLAGGDTRARAISKNGVVAGFESSAGGFIWSSASGIEPTPGLGNPYGINDQGQVVGGGALIWDAVNGTRNLANLIPPNSGWELDFAFAINDAGDIVGYGQLNGQIRGFLLTPVPEPNTAALIVASVMSIPFSARRLCGGA